jgi:hypothetical protein
MKHLLILALSLITFSEKLTAQILGQSNPLSITGPQNNMKTEIPLAQPSVVGSSYLDENWKNAEIVLKSKEVIRDFPIKIEIEQANVEIKYNGEVKFLNLKEVDHIKYVDEKSGRAIVIRSANPYTIDGQVLRGIVEILLEGGQYEVVKHYYIKLLQANYNVAMDVGPRDHRKVVKDKVYLSQGDKLILIKGSAKKWTSQLGADKERALQIIRDHKLNASKDIDLITLASLLQK